MPARRNRRLAERRAKRRPTILVAGVAAAVVTMVGFAGAVPVSYADASGSSPAFALASYSTTAASGVPAAKAVADEASTDARQALTTAEAAVAAAEKVTADIEASGLDVGVSDTSVDTTTLAGAADRLEIGVDSLPEALLPDATGNVTELVASVNEQVSALRGRLDAAIAAEKARKAAEEKARKEAEEKARREAEAAKAAKAQAAQSSGSSWTPPAGGGGSGDNSPAGAQATARAMLGGYGWGDDQFGCLLSLWNRESGWNYQAYNRSSGAYGIPQALPGSKMATAGADWQYSARTQIAWGLGYIAGRYGTPCGAWGHSQSVGWY